MADFCRQCSINIFDRDFKDMVTGIPEGDIARVLCEGCGLTFVDHKGECIHLHETDIDYRGYHCTTS